MISRPHSATRIKPPKSERTPINRIGGNDFSKRSPDERSDIRDLYYMFPLNPHIAAFLRATCSKRQSNNG
jgi:hypothetical protein